MLFLAATLLVVLPGTPAAPSPHLTGEIRSYHQVGDKIRGEYSRLHPDGSVTKTWAFGDTKSGLQYKTYQMDPQGNVKSVTPQQQQQVNQQPQQQNQAPPQQQLNQAAPQQQITDPSSSGAPAQTNVSPGVNWFLQQPLMSSMTPGADPFAPEPFPAPTPDTQNPPIQDPLLNPFINNPFAPAPATNPLLGTNNPLWNWWNF